MGNSSLTKRDNNWLEDLMYEIWEDYFNDIPRKNLVIIKFGRRAKRQLGSIRWVQDDTRVKFLLSKREKDVDFQDDSRVTLITITSLFKSPKVPKYVVKSTIAHEMIHYAHGFFSPLKQRYDYPHQGSLIRKEMEERGINNLLKRSKRWLKINWKFR